MLRAATKYNPSDASAVSAASNQDDMCPSEGISALKLMLLIRLISFLSTEHYPVHG